jgi:hypothetical protein
MWNKEISRAFYSQKEMFIKEIENLNHVEHHGSL